MHHPLQVLAHNHVCRIERCDGCNVLVVTVGPVTIRLQAAAAELLSGALVEALGGQELPPRPFPALGPPRGKLMS